MRSHLAFLGTLLLVTGAIFSVSDFSSAAPYLNEHLVVQNSFDGDYTNGATGAASAGSDGDAFWVGSGFSFVPWGAGFGEALRFGGGFNWLEWDDEELGIAPMADVAGANGLTWSMHYQHSGTPPAGVPAWLFNAQTEHVSPLVSGGTKSEFGARINTGVNSYRMTSPGSFFGGGLPATAPNYDHLVYTIVPEAGQFRAKQYLNGQLQDMSGLFPEIQNVHTPYIGQWTKGYEWRLTNANIDEFRMYNIGMDGQQVAQLNLDIGDGSSGPTPSPISNWVSSGTGNWEESHWDTPLIPNSNDKTARFENSTLGQSTVYIDGSVTIKRVEFEHSNTYAISGPGSLTIDADTGSSSIEIFAAGANDQHEIEVDLVLADNDLEITAAATTTLDINEPIALNGQTLNILGAGTVNLNSGTTGGGTINNSGTLGTASASSIGGNFNSTGTIDIDINGTGDLVQYDSLIVSGNATLGGTLDIDLADGVATPDSITILSASNITNNGIMLGGPDGDLFTIDPSALASGNLTLVTGGGGLAGDFNGDGTVDAADYTVWQDGLGDNTYTAADYDVWSGNFGATSATGSSTAVPEPGALLLCCGLVGAVLGSRRMR